MRNALALHDDAEQARQLARATGGDEDAIGALDRDAARRRAALGTGEARERVEEAVAAGALDPASHGAILSHLGRIATLEVLARRRICSCCLAAREKAVLGDRERSVTELAHDVRLAERPAALEAWRAGGASPPRVAPSGWKHWPTRPSGARRSPRGARRRPMRCPTISPSTPSTFWRPRATPPRISSRAPPLAAHPHARPSSPRSARSPRPRSTPRAGSTALAASPPPVRSISGASSRSTCASRDPAGRCSARS